jgi:putative endopeptidase
MVDDMTREQRFFIGWATAWRKQVSPERVKVLAAADPHSPAPVRASGTPTNMPTFAAAFSCKDGDPMVHTGAKLVTIW